MGYLSCEMEGYSRLHEAATIKFGCAGIRNLHFAQILFFVIFLLALLV
jgi:hypothetical protein